MADVVHKTTLEYRRSVNTPDYWGGDWLVNPDLPGCARKYWKIKSGKVVEMTTSEKSAVDAAEQAAVAATTKDSYIDSKIKELASPAAIQALKTDGVLDSNGDLI
jgi:hypothetical protein